MTPIILLFSIPFPSLIDDLITDVRNHGSIFLYIALPVATLLLLRQQGPALRIIGAVVASVPLFLAMHNSAIYAYIGVAALANCAHFYVKMACHTRGFQARTFAILSAINFAYKIMSPDRDINVVLATATLVALGSVVHTWIQDPDEADREESHDE